MFSNKIYIQNMQIVFVCVILAFKYSSFGQDLNEKCESSDGIDGYCKDVRNCDKAVRSILENRTHFFKRCGFESTREIICCPFDASASRPHSSGENLPMITKSPEMGPSKIHQKIPSQNAKDENKTIKHHQRDTQLRISERGELIWIENCIPPNGAGICGKNLNLETTFSKTCRMYEEKSVGLLRTLIIGGNTADADEFPHMAAIKMNYSDITTICGGSLISKRHILTVAHCLMDGEGNSPVTVQLGTSNDSDVRNSEVTLYGIETFIIHPQYLRRMKYHDIGIIKLDRDVIMMNSKNYIYPACLNTDSNYPSSGDQLIITGWGLTDEEKASDVLMKATVGVVSMEDCAKAFNKNRGLVEGVTSGQLCAGGKGTDSCNGDSGGPLQSPQPSNSGLFRIIGLTSFGYVCGSDRPGVYTRVSHYLEWIESIVWPDKML